MPITIKKAIELLLNLDKRGHFAPGDDITPAIQLSIEALKRIKFGRNHPSGWELGLLPGETEEV